PAQSFRPLRPTTDRAACTRAPFPRTLLEFGEDEPIGRACQAATATGRPHLLQDGPVKHHATSTGCLPSDKTKHLPAVALAALVAACSGGAKSPASPSISNGAWSVSADGRSVIFSGADAGTLLTFDTDGFQLGTVRALDDSRSYDPYWLVVND